MIDSREEPRYCGEFMGREVGGSLKLSMNQGRKVEGNEKAHN